MLSAVIQIYEIPVTGTLWAMPQEAKEKTVEMIDNGIGDGVAIYRVGRKMVCVNFGEDPIRDDVFVTTIESAYVKSLKKERGYFVPKTFEIDSKTGFPKEISKEDERLLIDKLVEDERFSMSNREVAGKKPKIYRTIGKYFSTENGVVISTPETPEARPRHREDRQLVH